MGAGTGRWEWVQRALPCGSAYAKDGVRAGPKKSVCRHHSLL